MGPMVIDSCLPPCSVHGPSVLGPVNPTTAGDDPRWLVGAVPPKKALSGALGVGEFAMLFVVLKARNNAIFVFLVACRQGFQIWMVKRWWNRCNWLYDTFTTVLETVRGVHFCCHVCFIICCPDIFIAGRVFFSSVLGHSANCPFWSLELSFKKIIGMLMLTHSLPPYITLWCWNSQDESDPEATLSYPSLWDECREWEPTKTSTFQLSLAHQTFQVPKLEVLTYISCM